MADDNQNQSTQNQGGEGAGAGNAAGQGNNDQGSQNQQQQNQQGDQGAKSWYDKDSWRKEMSGGDEKIAKRLERFTDPSGILKSYLAAEQKITSGEYKRSVKPENANEDQLKQWRLESGIPDTAEGYDFKIDEKLMVEGDKESLDKFYKFAHESDIPKAHIEKIVSHLYSTRKEQADQLVALDNSDKTEAEETLRVEFGNDYLPNMNLMKGMFDGQPEDIRTAFMGARLEDGTRIMNSPEIVKMLVSFAREINPAAAYVPNSGGANTAQSIGDEIATIERFMRTNRDEYYKDKTKQARYDQLLVARDKLKSRAA